jgi:hypothetical protein
MNYTGLLLILCNKLCSTLNQAKKLLQKHTNMWSNCLLSELPHLPEDVGYYDSVTAFVLYAWRISCSVYSWYEALSAIQLPRSMDRTKWTGLVVSTIAHCSSCLILPVGPPGKESVHGLGLGAWLNWLRRQYGTCLVYFGVSGILSVKRLNYAFKLTQSVFSNFCR